MLHDFKQAIPDITVRGIDISNYAISNSLSTVKKYLKTGNAKKLTFPDNYFDLTISITTLHNLNLNDFKKSIKEIQRVSKKSFITVDSYRNNIEKKRMDAWNLTAQTYMHRKDWIKLFNEIHYKGDYFWFIP